MATIRAPLEEVVGLAPRTRARAPGFRELVAEHDPLIVSAGFHELIEPVLAARGSRSGSSRTTSTPTPRAGGAAFPEGPLCAVCGERCKRGAVAGLGRFAYVGDGVSDRCVVARRGAPFRARGPRRWLDGQGVAYEPFDDLHDVRSALAAR